MCALRAQLRLVCHQLKSPQNLGAMARLMANFGFHRLVLSDPVTYAFREAEKMALGGEHLLETLTIVQSLPEALGPGVYAVGTTSRAALKRRQALTPEQAVSRLVEESRRGPVSLVLGGEKRGLSDDELAQCQDVLVIPTEAAQPSMNISQAAGVLLYLCAKADTGKDTTTNEPLPEGARLQTLHAVEQRLEEVLLKAGFLNPQAPQHACRALMATLARSRLEQREAEMWLSALQHVNRLS